MSVHTRIGMLLAVLAAIASPPALADTAVATKWRPITEAQPNCLAHARVAIVNTGFNEGEPSSQSLSGKRGDYTASIRCISEQNIVFFVMSGPSADEALRYLDQLYARFP